MDQKFKTLEAKCVFAAVTSSVSGNGILVQYTSGGLT
jgi:hypothetical protein